jgi:SAM-dependent methyltransferase
MIPYFPPRYLFRRYEILRHIRPAECFLEVGAGGLALSSELTRYFTRGHAIDFSPEIAEIYQQLPDKIREKLTFQYGDIYQLPSGKQYDCIIACEVMEHIEDDAQFLRFLKSLLTPQGQLILSVPARMKFWTVHDDIVGHLRRYEKAELMQLMQRVGFESVKIMAYGYPFVNGLRFLRALYAKKQAVIKQQWTAEQQTQHSGIHHVPRSWNSLGLLVNPYTFLPLNWIACLFNGYDLSEGYLIIAQVEKMP